MLFDAGRGGGGRCEELEEEALVYKIHADQIVSLTE